MLHLRGSIPANLLPFDEQGDIDEREYRRHLGWLIDQPIGGVTCNGHASEVVMLDHAERRRSVAIAAEVIGGRVPLISGVYAENYRQAITSANEAVAEGADALLVFPLNSLLFDFEKRITVDHFRALDEAVGAPMVAFLYPQQSGLSYDLEVIEELLQIPTVVAVKEFSQDVLRYEQHLRLMRQADHHVSMLSSFSSSLLATLAIGADGILSGYGSVVCEQHAALLDAVDAHDLAAADAIYSRLQVLNREIYRHPFGNMFARMKAQSVMLGRLNNAYCRPPIRPLGAAEWKTLREALSVAGYALGDLEGVS